MVNSLSIIQLSSSWVRLTFGSSLSSPTFSIYRDGTLIGETNRGTFDAVSNGGEVFEVVDQGESAEKGYPGHIVIQWLGMSTAVQYLVEQLIGGEWTEIGRYSETSKGYYQHRTDTLSDGVVHEFRVRGVSAAGNLGTAVSVVSLMVRYPDVPDVTYALSGNKVLISQA